LFWRPSDAAVSILGNQLLCKCRAAPFQPILP
jgi:hypothetical protein